MLTKHDIYKQENKIWRCMKYIKRLSSQLLLNVQKMDRMVSNSQSVYPARSRR